MLIAAERTLVDGLALEGMGVAVNAHGGIDKVAPLASLGAPTHQWPNELLAPGFVDVCAQDLADLAQEVHSGSAPTFALTRALHDRLQRGITTVGIPHSPKSRFAPEGWAAPFGEADLIIAAAQSVGLRVALLDTLCVAPKAGDARCSHSCAASLDEAIGAFEQLVHHVLGCQDRRLSWAMWAPLGSGLPLDALIGLRLRLSHLPCLISLVPPGSEEAATPQSSAAQVRTLAQRNLLDACATVLDSVGLPAASLEVLARLGATRLVGQRGMHSGLTALSGGQHTAPCPTALTSAQSNQNVALPAATPNPHNPLASAQVWLHAATAGGTRALGLRGGGLAPHAWADAFTVPLDDPALCAVLPHHLAPEEAWPIALAASAQALRVRRTLVAGLQAAES